LSDVIVVGAGVGGLSCAIHLAKSGLDVHVLEAQDQPGGCCQTSDQEGYKFEDGALWLSQDYLCRIMFGNLGLDFDAIIPSVRLNPSTRCLLSNGERFEFSVNTPKVADQIASLSSADGMHFERFMKEMARREVFLDRLLYDGPLTWKTLLIPGFLRNLGFLLESYEHAVGRFFQDELVKLVFARPTLFLGLPPSHSPASFLLSAYGEITSGSCYPIGGMGQIPDRMKEIAEGLGVRFSFGTRVRKIVTQRKATIGVELQDGEFLSAHRIVSNAHVKTTYMQLVGPDYLPRRLIKRLNRLDLGHSYYMVQLGIDQSIQGPANQPLFPPPDAFEHFLLETHSDLPDRLYPNVAIFPKDAHIAPDGGSVIGIYHVVPYRSSAGTWDEIKEQLADRLIDQVETVTGLELRKHIVTQRVRTPEDLKRDFNLPQGAMYGLAPTFWQSGLGRPRQKSPWIKGLYLVGQTTHPGLGVANGIYSGAMTAGMISAGL
jgi:phytoene desaturase